MSSIKLILVLSLVAMLTAQSIYSSKTYVNPITPLNFENQVNKIRQTTRFVTVIHFYQFNDGFSKGFSQEYEGFADEYRGAFRISGCDCDEDSAICEKEGITKFPTFRIYPPMPIPTIDIEGEITAKNILNKAAGYLQMNIIELTSANVNQFIEEHPSVPKCILFTEKQGNPLIFKGLSIAFEKKIFFGIVRKEQEALVSRYQIKAFPSIIVVKANEQKPHRYTGEFKFTPIQDWINVFSEVFVPGGGSSSDSAATREWLTVVVPEITAKSVNDICLKVQSTLCVILFSNGRPSPRQIETLEGLNSYYDRKIKRGSDFQYMWIDTKLESSWATWLGVENTPSVVILNPAEGQQRYLTHEGDLSLDSLKSTIEKINGGDARFTRLKTSNPALSLRA